MIRGLHVTITGEELINRLSGRIEQHEARVTALDARLEARRDDLPFDIRDEDGWKTVPELRAERAHYAGRAATLALLRDSVVADEEYVLGKIDMQLAELITVDHIDYDEIPVIPVKQLPRTVDGLKLTFSGEELRERLAERINERERRADWWAKEAERSTEEDIVERPVLPTHMCRNEADEERWYAEVLTFIRDHVDGGASYSLSEDDLHFSELLPERPEPVGPCDDDVAVGMIEA
jgi:hypothetical protein